MTVPEVSERIIYRDVIYGTKVPDVVNSRNAELDGKI